MNPEAVEWLDTDEGQRWLNERFHQLTHSGGIWACEKDDLESCYDEFVGIKTNHAHCGGWKWSATRIPNKFFGGDTIVALIDEHDLTRSHP